MGFNGYMALLGSLVLLIAGAAFLVWRKAGRK